MSDDLLLHTVSAILGGIYFLGYIIYMVKNWNNSKVGTGDMFLYWIGGTMIIALFGGAILYMLVCLGIIVGIPYGLFYGLRKLTTKNKK